jgi:hypothetical protein
MARKSKGTTNGKSKQNGRLSRRTLLGLGTGLALTSLAPGKKLLATEPTPTPSVNPCSLGKDQGQSAIQSFDFSKYRVGIDMKKGVFKIASSEVGELFIPCKLEGFETIIFRLKKNEIQFDCPIPH